MEIANNYEDPMGFTKQTAVMLLGLGASDLIPQLKKRNVSTQDLPRLTKEDFIALGADEETALKIFKELKFAKKRTNSENFWEERKMDELVKVLVGGNNQLNLIEIAISYARLKMAEKAEDLTIDTTKNIRMSQALCFALNSTIKEIDELERNFQELASLIRGKNEKEMKKSKLFGLIAGLGVTAGVLCIFKCALVTLKKS